MTITGKWAKGLVAAAIVSFGLNLFLAGFMIAGGPWHDRWGHRMGWGGGPFFGGGHSEMHEMMHEAMAAKGFDRDQMRKDMRATAERIAELLQAETVDQAQLEATIAPMADKLKGAIDAIHQAMIETAMKMPVEKRKELAEALLRHRR